MICLSLIVTTGCNNGNQPQPQQSQQSQQSATDTSASTTSEAVTNKDGIATLPADTSAIVVNTVATEAWTGPEISNPSNTLKYDGLVSRLRSNLESHGIKIVAEDTTTPIVSMEDTNPLAEDTSNLDKMDDIMRQLYESFIQMGVHNDGVVRLTEFTKEEKSRTKNLYYSAYDQWKASVITQLETEFGMTEAQVCQYFAAYILHTHKWMPAEYFIALNAIANGTQRLETAQSALYKQLVPTIFSGRNLGNETDVAIILKSLINLEYALSSDEALDNANNIGTWHIYTDLTPNKFSEMLKLKQTEWGATPITLNKTAFGINNNYLPYVVYMVKARDSKNNAINVNYVDTLRGFNVRYAKQGYIGGTYNQSDLDMTCIYKSLTYLAMNMNRDKHSHLYSFLEDNIFSIYTLMKGLDDGSYTGDMVSIASNGQSEYDVIVQNMGSTGSKWYTFMSYIKIIMENDVKYVGAWDELCSLVPANRQFSDVVAWFDAEPTTNIGMYEMEFSNGLLATFYKPLNTTERFAWAVQLPIANEITEDEFKKIVDTYIALVGIISDYDYAQTLDAAIAGLVGSTSTGNYSASIDYMGAGAILTIAKG